MLGRRPAEVTCWRRKRALINAQFRAIRREQQEFAARAAGSSAEREVALLAEARAHVVRLLRETLWRNHGS